MKLLDYFFSCHYTEHCIYDNYVDKNVDITGPVVKKKKWLNFFPDQVK